MTTLHRPITAEEIKIATEERAKTQSKTHLLLMGALQRSRELQRLYTNSLKEELADLTSDYQMSEVYYEELANTLEAMRAYSDSLDKLRDNVELIEYYGKLVHDVLRAIIPEMNGLTKLVQVSQRQYRYSVQPKKAQVFALLPDGDENPHVPQTEMEIIDVNLMGLQIFDTTVYVDYDSTHNILFVLCEQ